MKKKNNTLTGFVADDNAREILAASIINLKI